VAEIDAAKQLVVDRNNLPDAYVRSVAWRGSEMMGVSAQTNTIHLAVAAWEWPSYFDPAESGRASASALPTIAGLIRGRSRPWPRPPAST
jgi:branched-subunit amino acid aminotransferase/4-amino-4-deoxychorismate lyase